MGVLSYPIIVQARMDSRRLPGKMLTPFGGETLISHQLKRLSKLTDEIIVATSVDKSDNELVESISELGFTVVRGPVDDVYSRFFLALEGVTNDAFFRYCADRPFFDLNLMVEAEFAFKEGMFDIVTNVHPQTYPFGQTVELLSKSVFVSVDQSQLTKYHREHVTSYFYQGSDYKIKNLSSADSSFRELNMCVDSFEDLELALKVHEQIVGQAWSWIDVAKLYRSIS